MRYQIRLFSLFLTVTLLNRCSEDLKTPSYLKSYQIEYQKNPNA